MLFISKKTKHKNIFRKYSRFRNKNKFVYKIRYKKDLKITRFLKCFFHMKLTFIFLLFLIFFSFKKKKLISNIIKSNNKIPLSNTKICICTLAKQENLYIREYLDHYKNYGVNKIYLYDNNDINGEKFEDVINDYINSGFVELSNWRGRREIQHAILNDCYRKHKDNYDWVMFSEILYYTLYNI